MFFALGFFDVRRFRRSFAQNAFEDDMAIEAGARGLAERLDTRINKALRIVYVFSAPAPAHQRLPQGAPSA